MPSHRRKPIIWIWLGLTLLLLGFWALWGSSYDRLVLINTFTLGILAAVVSIPCGVLLANAGARSTVLGRTTLLLTLAFALVPIVFQVSCWDAAFGKLGWVTASFTGANQPIVSAWFATIWIHAVSLAPQIAILYLVMILGGPKVHEEQALLDSTPWQVLWNVTYPRYLPVTAAALGWSIICCSREIAVTDIYQIGTVAEQVYLGFSLGQFSTLLGTGTATQLASDNSLSLGLQVSTIAWLVLSAVLVFSALIPRDRHSESFLPVRTKTPQRIAGKIATLLTLLLLFGVPVWNLIARASFQVTRIDGRPVGGHSLDSISHSLRRAVTDYSPQTYWSLLIAVFCVAITLAVGVLFAWLAKQNRGVRFFLLVFISICFALPGPVIGTGLLKIYTQIDTKWIEFLFNRTIAPTVLAAVIVCLPITVVLLWFIFSSTPEDLEEHLHLEGGGHWKAFWQLGINANLKPITGVAILCFILAYGDLSATQMVLPPGVETVPRLTLGLMHSGVNNMTAALSIVNISTILLVSLAGWWLISLKWRKRRQQ